MRHCSSRVAPLTYRTKNIHVLFLIFAKYFSLVMETFLILLGFVLTVSKSGICAMIEKWWHVLSLGNKRGLRHTVTFLSTVILFRNMTKKSYVKQIIRMLRINSITITCFNSVVSCRRVLLVILYVKKRDINYNYLYLLEKCTDWTDTAHAFHRFIFLNIWDWVHFYPTYIELWGTLEALRERWSNSSFLYHSFRKTVNTNTNWLIWELIVPAKNSIQLKDLMTIMISQNSILMC